MGMSVRSTAIAAVLGLASIAPGGAVGAPYRLVRTLPGPQAPGDLFGAAGTRLGGDVIVTAPGAPQAGGGEGAAYVLALDTGLVRQTLPNPTGDMTLFGASVAATGDAIVVGAPNADAVAPGETRGAAYVFDAATGALLRVLQGPDPLVSRLFAFPGIAQSGTDALVSDFGSQAVHRFDVATGELLATYARVGPPFWWGGAIVSSAVLGDRVFVGSPGDSAVLVFDAASGALLDTFSGPAGADGFGLALAVAGGALVVSAPAQLEVDGAGYVLDPATGTVLRVLSNPDPATPRFGWSVAASGNAALIGAPGDPDAGIPGAVYVFDVATGALLERLDDPVAGAGFGTSITTIDGSLVIGAPGAWNIAGAAYLFTPCGDGTIDPGEDCDDGNQTAGDGCSVTCQGEDGFPCDDGNPCTADDVFAGGVCGGTCQPGAACAGGACEIGADGGCTCAPAGTTTTTTTSTAPTTSTTTTSLPPDPAAVAPPIDPTVAADLATATAFLYTGEHPIQTGVAPGTIDARRAAVLRGNVRTRDGAPLPGVTIRVLDHPELGQTLSRTDGTFDLVVNGGGSVTVDYALSGHLPAQRQVAVPWQDYVIVPDVALVAKDAAVTAIDLTATTSVQVARGSIVTDDDGTRQATLLFPQGTQAELVFADGTTEAVDQLHVRATEYTVGSGGPAAMPAGLPPASAYTYAVELSADELEAAGAVSVRFDPPLPFYVDNFLGFPAGGPVPAGYYDRRCGCWVASDNGRILAIVGVDAGQALVDTNGDGVPESAGALAALGITAAERTTVASLYPIGQTLWRVPIPHLTPWDCNWPYLPPADASGPGQPAPGPDIPPDDVCPVTPASVIGAEGQTLGEEIAVVGAPFALRYQSDRVPGYTAAATLQIPLSGPTVPSSLKRIDVDIEIAGRKTTQSYAPAPGQMTAFTWDGVDAYGRIVRGSQTATVRIGYVYDADYRRPEDLPRLFALLSSGLPFVGNVLRQEFTFPQEHRVMTLHVWDARGQVGGWSPTLHHVYDPAGRVLYLGDGSRRTADADVVRSIRTIAGTGTPGFGGDGGPARNAEVNPVRIASGPDGSVYLTGSNRVRRIGPDGLITTVAGTGTAGFSGDGGPATAAQLNGPVDVTVAADGSLFVADTNNNRVRRVDPDGIITTIAGTGTGGYAGDGGPATAAQLWLPRGVAVGPDCSIYVSDNANLRIRRIAPDGTIATVAGSGAFGFAGDGGPATQARLAGPQGLAVGADGTLYIADDPNHRIRKVEPSGRIATVAGSGVFPGFDGDGGPATSALLARPQQVRAAADGSLYIADFNNGRIRYVGPDGVISTLAGGGGAGGGADGGPATAAVLRPTGVALLPDGRVAIGEPFDGLVRTVAAPLPRFSPGEVAIPDADAREIYVFTPAGRHLRTLDFLTGGTRWEFTYDVAGRLATIRDGDGNASTIVRDGDGMPTMIAAPGGQQTVLTVDARGYLATVVNPAGEATELTYTDGGLLTVMRTPRGHEYQFQYDGLGRLQRDDDPAGGFKALDRTGLPEDYAVAVTTAEGRQSTYHVEMLAAGGMRRTNTPATGLATTVHRATNGARSVITPHGTTFTGSDGPDPRFGMLASSASTRQTTTPGGLVTVVAESRSAALADPDDLLTLASATRTVTTNGQALTEHYDGATRTLTETTAEGRVLTTALDVQGRVASTQVTGLAPIALGRDATGLLRTVTRGTALATRQTTFEYDAHRRLQSITDPSERAVHFIYDDADRLTSQTLPDGAVVTITYDASGNVASLTPPIRPAHAFTYTPVDLEDAYTPPAVGGPVATQYSYNLDRQLTQVTRPDGDTVIFTYEPATGRLASRATADDTVTYGYHPMTGQLTTLGAASGESLAYTYDGSLRTSATWSGPVAGTVATAYDAFLRPQQTSVNGTHAAARVYDADGLLTATGALSLTRHAAHGLVTASALGTVGDGRTYNPFGELDTYTATANGGPALEIAYQRDAVGRIIEKTETVLGGTPHTTAYGYDARGRLETVNTDGASTVTYVYDENGNRLARTTSGGGLETGTYDGQDRLLAYAGAVYTYTANGDLATKTVGGVTTAYHYDALGNLRSVERPDGTAIEYVIDPENRRVGKRVDGVLVQGFLYEDGLRIAAELDGAGTVVSRFVYGTRVNVPEYVVKGGVTYRLVTDHLGSPRLVIDASDGTVVQRMEYDEFGRVLTNTNSGFQPFGFAGGLYDLDTELVRFGARDYDPGTGRWIARDPLLFAAGDSNLYGYAFHDPVNVGDPDGQIAPLVLGVAAAVVTVGAVAAVVFGELQCAEGCVGGDLRDVGRRACDANDEVDPRKIQEQHECIARCGLLGGALAQLFGFTDPFNTAATAIGQFTSGESLP